MYGSLDVDGVREGRAHGKWWGRVGKFIVMAMNPALYKPLPVSHIRRPMAILSILLTVIIVTVSILMVLIVLAQRPKQEGLGAAFGGSTLDSALGAHTTDILQKITTWLGILFFVSAIGLAMVKTREFRASAASDVLKSVENRETEMPTLPPELQNLSVPESSAPAPVIDDAPVTESAPAKAAPKADAPKEKAKASKEKAPKAKAPKGKAKEAAEKGKAAE
ncbi:MAG: preprotein translocase subunit SecG [Verrucomicrobiales bacterium]|nr:preprotein translocase subunit SecG [Verrucomicrobiales bacterium]